MELTEVYIIIKIQFSDENFCTINNNFSHLAPTNDTLTELKIMIKLEEDVMQSVFLEDVRIKKKNVSHKLFSNIFVVFNG